MEPRSAPDHVLRLGADHPALGALDVAALDASTAVGISAGRMPKPYPHLDPNEDAALAARGAAGTLLTVADGHSGFDAARAAVTGVRGCLHLLDDPRTDPRDIVAALLVAAREAVREAMAEAPPERRQSRTALSIALLAGGRLVAGGWGDTQVVRVRGGRTRMVGTDGPFLEPSSVVEEPVGIRLKPGDLALVCSDGLRDYLDGDWTGHAAQVLAGSRDASAAAKALIEAAWSGGAGDHVSVAVTQWEP